ncbi:MAG: hypothetical protein K2M31_06195 [Muribaculaceae bacterium]|nr:hypothetical protein [Muribaculaceae bacterium]
MFRNHPFLILLLLGLIVSGLTACQENSEIIRSQYFIACSPDLKQFVTPEVIFTDDNGIERTVELTQNDFTLTPILPQCPPLSFVELLKDGIKVEINKDFRLNYWSQTESFESRKVKDFVKLTYKVVENPQIDPNKKYVFYQGFLGTSTKYYEDDKLVETSYNSNQIEIKVVRGTKEVKDYLDYLSMISETLTIDVSVESVHPTDNKTRIQRKLTL